jgi:hypothetical protein
MRISILSFVLLTLLSFSSYGSETENCRSYVKGPNLFICLQSNNEEEVKPQTPPKIMTDEVLPIPIENTFDNPNGPSDSAFLIEDENGEIQVQPRISNDFSGLIN